MRQFSFFELVPSNVTLKVQIKKLFLSFFCFIFDLEVVVILWSFAIGSRNEPTIYSAPSSIYKSTNCACFSIVSILTLLLYNNFAASLHIWWYSVICNGKLNAYVSAFINLEFVVHEILGKWPIAFSWIIIQNLMANRSEELSGLLKQWSCWFGCGLQNWFYENYMVLNSEKWRYVSW